MNKQLKICFTGHRPDKLPWGYNETLPSCIAFKDNLRKILEKAIQNNYTYFISGMALGVDMICAEIVLELKDKHPQVFLEAAIPCPNQTRGWRDVSINRYKSILEKCDSKTIISPKYTDSCMNDRNKYMIDRADAVIAVWNGIPSGTGNTVRFAKEKGKKVRIINPQDYKDIV